MEDCLMEAMGLLTQITDDLTIAKSVRRVAGEVINVLREDCELPVRCDKALQLLTIGEDPNMDVYTKTQIWSLLSILESIS